MSTEKIIKKQARLALRGNWSVMIAAVAVVCTVLILIEALFYFFCFFSGIVIVNTGAVLSSMQAVFAAGAVVKFLLILNISPLINGVVRLFCNASLGKEADIFELFYFFRSAKRYLKTLLVNFVLMLIYSALSYAFDAYFYASQALNADLIRDFNFDLTTLALVGAFLATVIIKAAVFLLFAYYPTIAYSFNDSLPARRYMFGFIGFSFRHFAESAKLVLSLVGWIVSSCLLVVPVIYTLPYAGVSAATSAKWLFSLYKL